jgi:hypothetical protein
VVWRGDDGEMWRRDSHSVLKTIEIYTDKLFHFSQERKSEGAHTSHHVTQLGSDFNPMPVLMPYAEMKIVGPECSRAV